MSIPAQLNLQGKKSINQAISAITTTADVFFLLIDYIFPLLIVFTCFTKYSPAYTLLRSIYNFEQDGGLFTATIQIGSGIAISFAAMITLSGCTLCVIITGFGLIVLYLWTLFIIPQDEETKARKILIPPYFFDRILIHNSLKIMAIFHIELCRAFVISRLHHLCAVVVSSGCLYYILVSSTRGGESVFLVTATSLIIIGVMTFVELFAIYFMSNAVTTSKQFLHRVGYIYGTHKYAARVLKGLLPNSMNLEFITSLCTLVNGIEMNYFLNYVERVTDNAITLLFASK